MRALLLALATPLNLPFARELWSANPSDLIAQVQEPVLVVIGRKDIQADWQADGGALERAAAENGNAEFAYPEEADHVLKHEDRPLDAIAAAGIGTHYNREGRTLDAATLTVITSWLRDHARP
jgi:uncharacterized protein